MRIWQGDPVIGIGLKNFRLECANDHFLARGPVEDRCYTHPHHIYLEWLVESGAHRLRRLSRAAGALGPRHRLRPQAHRPRRLPDRGRRLAALIVFLWPLRASMSFFSNWNATLFWLMLGLALALTASQGRRPVPDRHQAVTPPS